MTADEEPVATSSLTWGFRHTRSPRKTWEEDAAFRKWQIDRRTGVERLKLRFQFARVWMGRDPIKTSSLLISGVSLIVAMIALLK